MLYLVVITIKRPVFQTLDSIIWVRGDQGSTVWRSEALLCLPLSPTLAWSDTTSSDWSSIPASSKFFSACSPHVWWPLWLPTTLDSVTDCLSILYVVGLLCLSSAWIGSCMWWQREWVRVRTRLVSYNIKQHTVYRPYLVFIALTCIVFSQFLTVHIFPHL